MFPDAFKIAKVIPLYKSNDITITSNYRPISLLSTFSKILEKIVKDQLTKYVNESKVLCENQFGFRKSKNITDALFLLTRDFNEAIIKNKRSMVVFLDLAKAFDTVDRTKLLRKLQLLGVKENAYKWFESYFENRVQMTTINGINSKLKTVDFGVIQGSTLGPLLFLIYINNLAKVYIGGKLYMFADDTAIFFQADSWEEVFELAPRNLTLIKKWFDQNLLTLNITKTKFLPLSLRDNVDTDVNSIKFHSCGDSINYTCNCDSIERVNEYK